MKQSELLELYVRQLVRNEVKKIVKEELELQLTEILSATVSAPLTEGTTTKKKPSREEIVRIMKQAVQFDGDTLKANTGGVPMSQIVPPEAELPDFVQTALTRDYSELMKAMNK